MVRALCLEEYHFYSESFFENFSEWEDSERKSFEELKELFEKEKRHGVK